MSFRRAAAIQFGSRYLNVFLQLILTAILARLLSPNDYGIIAGISIFTNLFGILADMGLGPAIIQYKNLTKNDYGSIFLFSLGLGSVLTLAFIGLGFPIAWFFRVAAYTHLCAWSAISIFFSTIDMVANGILLKEKRFDLVGFRLIVTTIIGGVVAVTMALNGFGAMSLIWNINIISILVFFWNFISVRGQISFSDIHIVHSMRIVARYSSYQAGFGLVNYFSRNLDHLIIGRISGSAPLGLYDKAYKLTTYPIQFVPGVLGSIIQPFLSMYQDKKEKLYEAQSKMISVLAMIGSMATFLFLLCNKELIYFAYGSQWMQCVPLFTILSISITFQMVNNITGSILQSAGRTDYLFAQGIFATVIMVVFVLIGAISKNLYTVTAMVTAAFVLQTITVAYFTTVKTFSHKLFDFFKPILPSAITSTICFLPLAVIKYYFEFLTDNYFISFSFYTSVYILMTVCALLLTGQLKTLKVLFTK
ncbi:lipopolysaccharide biosynthesis protein [Bifidobacterium aquikefiricola]|uniref:Lipopolysaccharide biosynthesis protein n=1 Tax=Bifidobacterium aquikefiricola TaxID=3059038 RepID=A0AB39U509_9BIFI